MVIKVLNPKLQIERRVRWAVQTHRKSLRESLCRDYMKPKQPEMVIWETAVPSEQPLLKPAGVFMVEAIPDTMVSRDITLFKVLPTQAAYANICTCPYVKKFRGLHPKQNRLHNCDCPPVKNLHLHKHVAQLGAALIRNIATLTGWSKLCSSFLCIMSK